MTDALRSKYIYARRWGLTAEATNYQIINRKSDDTLGYVEYYKPWNCWVFQPKENTEYSAGCLRDIADFIAHPNRS